jgi:hypothetical protein
MNKVKNKIIFSNMILIKTNLHKDYHDYVINDIYFCFLILQIINDACIFLLRSRLS